MLKKHLKLLYDFHLDTLRKLQALLNRTSNAAVLLLHVLGALPLGAELDKRHLSLLFSCLKSVNTKLVLLAKRQFLYYDSEGKSFFTRVKKYCPKMSYQIWILFVKLTFLKSSGKSKLKPQSRNTGQHFSIVISRALGIGQTHPVWDSLESTRLEVWRGVVKSHIVTGTYIVQSICAKFNQYQIDSTCPLCHLEDEDIIHMHLRCSVLHSVRKGPFRTLKDYVISRTSEAFWKSVFSTKINITRLIIDCSQIEELRSVKDIDLLYIEMLTRNVCFAIYKERLKVLYEG